MTAFVFWVMIVTILAAAAIVIHSRRKTRHLLERLDDMLEKAIAQGFTEEDYDESLLSAVETRLAQYLASSTVSARNLQEEKDKIKTLIADISHQTKTPLSNILLYAQLLSEQPLPKESSTCVKALEAQAEKLKSLIEALVKTSRLESGVLTMHPEPAGLSFMLEDSVAQFLPKAAEKGITLTLDTAEGEGFFDPKWTAEAVCNLLDNALKYTPFGGSVTVRTFCYELFCRIDVADTGCGISEEEQAKVFQRFYRCPDNYQTQGVGIGLYLARQIAEGQGGYLKVTSLVGTGSTFSLYLPRG